MNFRTTLIERLFVMLNCGKELGIFIRTELDTLELLGLLKVRALDGDGPKCLYFHRPNDEDITHLDTSNTTLLNH